MTGHENFHLLIAILLLLCIFFLTISTKWIKFPTFVGFDLALLAFELAEGRIIPWLNSEIRGKKTPHINSLDPQRFEWNFRFGHFQTNRKYKDYAYGTVFTNSRQHVCHVRRKIQMSDVGFVKIIIIWCLRLPIGRRRVKSIQEDWWKMLVQEHLKK